ncbi:MAG TPA: bifunctional oligoribonuclease/PAP phosphatase NrnA [Campylobacterales bacterium]|nr:bifunctional oligoribonuclease/PAP phosphatase NrnA [Campylobacterales bacterium]HIP41722.1 bifunctional oligoribonuclease/PAP phosphatase NrnA [Campylobacterales bacterium]
MSIQIKSLIDKYNKITVLSHINPDADTIGTALGIYTLLKGIKKQVEVVNAEKHLPKHLDFLPNFSKIKNQIDFDDSLIISCDCASIGRLGIDLRNRDIVNIDHHKSNTNYGMLNIVKPTYLSASQVAFELFRDDFIMNKEIIICFYTALVSDTQYFTTNGVTKEVFDVASDMIAYDIDISKVTYNLNQRRSLTSLRILTSTLGTLELHHNGQIATMIANRIKMKEAGAEIIDTVGMVDHAIALVTVKIAIVLIELKGTIRASIRSKGVDVSGLAVSFGGGGHQNASGFELKAESNRLLLNKLLQKINKMELLNET